MSSTSKLCTKPGSLSAAYKHNTAAKHNKETITTHNNNNLTTHALSRPLSAAY
jgi:hypothetical protein